MNKMLWVTWRDNSTRRRYIIGELLYLDNKYIFKYVNPECDEARKCGFNGYPGFLDYDKVYESDDLFVNIATRLPSVKREDYMKILNKFDLNINSTKLDILIATKGRLVTDNFEFVPKFNKERQEFEVAGTSCNKHIIKYRDKLKNNTILLFERDYDNSFDEYAVKIYCLLDTEKCFLGFVPSYYSRDISNLLDKGIKYSAMIKSINFNSVFCDDNVVINVKLIFN